MGIAGIVEGGWYLERILALVHTIVGKLVIPCVDIMRRESLLSIYCIK